MAEVQIVTGDFVRTGGMDMANFALAEYLADCGDHVKLIAHRVAQSLARRSNVNCQHVPKPFNSYFLGAPLLDRVGRRSGRNTLDAGGRVIVNGGNCQLADVNWVHYVHAAYEPTMAGSSARRVKGALTRHLALAREASALRRARLVIVNSERTRRDLVDHLGLANASIHTVYYGIDAARFAPPSEQRFLELRQRFGWLDARPRVAFIGALGDRRKGFDTVFSAWTALCRSPSWDADLVVIGQGAELPAWQARAASLGLAQRIQFLGFRTDVPELLAACDALVAPTRYEAFGLGVLEALCTGIPALVSESAGVAECYPPTMADLLLGDSESSAELRARLEHWYQERSRLRGTTCQLATTLRQRGWQTMAREIRTLIFERGD